MKMEPSFLKNEAYRPFVVSTMLLFIISTISVIGYTVLSPTHSVLDAAYMTVISTTVETSNNTSPDIAIAQNDN